MKKLIGMSLIALFAMAAENTANGQVYYDTIVKEKDNGKHKVKIVPSQPDIYATPPPEVIEIFQDVPYYGYRRHKYYDEKGRKVIIYDDRVPYRRSYHYYYRYW